jgi:hypothetical protein
MSSPFSPPMNVSTVTKIPTLQIPNRVVEEPKLDLTDMKVCLCENTNTNVNVNDENRMRHCDQIYKDLTQNVKHPFFSSEENKEQIMNQLKQQIDYIYSRRYAKRRIG